jgi:hypothetical protein
MKAAGRSVKAISKAVGHPIHPTYVRLHKLGLGRESGKRKGVFWTSEETKKLISMWKQGISFEEIARVLGRSHFSVQKQYQKLVWQRRIGKKTISGVEKEIEKLKIKLKELEKRKSKEDENAKEAIDTLRDYGFFVLAFRVPRPIRKLWRNFNEVC